MGTAHDSFMESKKLKDFTRKNEDGQVKFFLCLFVFREFSLFKFLKGMKKMRLY